MSEYTPNRGKTYWRRCKWKACGKRVLMRKRQRFCCWSCAQYWHHSQKSPEAKHAHAVKAGKKAGIATYKAREARVLQLIAEKGITDLFQAYRMGYVSGYAAGWYRGARDIPGQMGSPRPPALTNLAS